MKSTAYHKILIWLPCFFVFSILIHPAYAQETQNEVVKCEASDYACVIKTLTETAQKIDNTAWRDQVYREIVKTMAAKGDFESAYALLDSIETPDTRALSIRGIGMAVADHKYEPAIYNQIFTTLRAHAEKIEHPPSYAIALTYIAMSQAFAGDNEGSWATAKTIENQALRNKAYGETAEIQAEYGDYKNARQSIEYIDTVSFRNKAYHTISKILSDAQKYDDAYDAAMSIDNPYKRALAIQYMLDGQNIEPNMEVAP
tara:strand:- start:482 stop:1255 length:774 start_codon:yes stop_codon:yes gene_type:complete